MDIFFFRRPLSTSIDAHSLLSLTLALSFFLSFLSLSTDNNNFTKDKVLSSRAKQQRAKQNPKKKKTRPRLLRKIYPQDFLSRSISFLPMAFSPTPPQNPKKKKTMLTRIPPATWLQIAPRLPFPKPHHTNKSTPFFASPI
jgi:hypothetical protein